MESEREHLKGASQGKWFFTKARVAVAVAIIKSRPQGMSGREHAEALSCKLKSQDESWKKKAQGLQQEVLRLRQEALITRATMAGQSNKLQDVPQDLLASESAALQLDADPTSRNLLPAFASPLAPAPSRFLADPRGAAELPHVHFLQSLCALSRVERSGKGLEAPWFGPDGEAGSLLADSVCQLLDSVVTACRCPPPPGPRDLVLQGCRVAAQAMDQFCSQRLPCADFTRSVEESLRELTAMLLHSNRLSTLQAADKHRLYLIILGSSTMSRSLLVGHILSGLSDVAERLWQAVQGHDRSVLDTFPLEMYHNSCYLFWVLEELLQKPTVPSRVELGAEHLGILSHLEQRVLLLSDEFPLFSICMWRIGSLLSSSEKELDSSASEQTSRVSS